MDPLAHDLPRYVYQPQDVHPMFYHIQPKKPFRVSPPKKSEKSKKDVKKGKKGDEEDEGKVTHFWE